MHKILKNNSNQSMILYLFLFMVAGMFSASALIMFLSGIIPQTEGNPWQYKISVLLQNVFMFILPAYTITSWSGDNAFEKLGIKRVENFWLNTLFVLFIFLFTIPFTSLLEQWNSNISFPKSLEYIENILRILEDKALQSAQALTGDKSISNLIINILLVGFLTALSEELFFRGAFQQFIEKWITNIHLTVWITAFVFSMLHFQFFGFFPRLLLGAVLGYLFIYSRNLWLPIMFHFINNSVVLILIHFDKSESPTATTENYSNVFLWLVALSGVLFTILLFNRLKLINKKQ